MADLAALGRKDRKAMAPRQILSCFMLLFLVGTLHGGDSVLSLTCEETVDGTLISWSGGGDCDSIEVERDGVVIATLDGGETSFLDEDLASVSATYRVIVEDDEGTARWCLTPAIEATLRGGDVVGSPGRSVEVPIFLESNLDVLGFDLGVSHDDGEVTLLEVLCGADVEDFNDGDGPSFFLAELEPGGDTAGFTAGVLFDLDTFDALSAGEEHEVLLVSYQVEGEAPSESTLEFTEELGDPAVGLRVVTEVFVAPTVPVRISASIEIEEPVFLRGDANDDGMVDLADPIHSLEGIFQRGEFDCRSAADFDGDGVLRLDDPIQCLMFLFEDGTDPAEPYPRCEQGALEGLTCVHYDSCP